MSDRSRHSQYSERRIPHDKRRISVYGEREDTGKWWRCWNCGFINDIDRSPVDTGEFGRTGVSVKTYVDTDGITKYFPDVVGGCKFCGSTNWT